MNSEHYCTKLGITGGKYFIKIVFDIKIKIGIFETSNVLNLNKYILSTLNFGTYLGLAVGNYLIKTSFDIKIEI